MEYGSKGSGIQPHQRQEIWGIPPIWKIFVNIITIECSIYAHLYNCGTNLGQLGAQILELYPD